LDLNKEILDELKKQTELQQEQNKHIEGMNIKIDRLTVAVKGVLKQ